MKVLFLHSHLDKFPEKREDICDEQGDRFHHDIKVMEDKYQGRWGKTMITDYC